jgi:isocitrate dehydrogenase
MESAKRPITVAYGDGIGPEIMQATLDIIQASGAQLSLEVIDIGERVYQSGHSAGIRPEAWESLRRTQVFLKAPITTPQGGGFKSLNVTTRKVLGLYANVRPCISYVPYVSSKHPVMDVVIVRENEEDLYAGIEHQQTDDVVQCLKLISRPGCEKIIRYAFEYAVMHNRKKVTCFTKDNIMKLTDGLFHKVFEEVAAEYPHLEHEHWIIDIGAAKLADTPEAFDVIVTPNLYGDIISDIAAQITGSVGLAGSANIGDQCAMFEAIHGSAPRRAGQNMANPSGLLLAAVQMLVHIDQPEVATRVHNAWLRTLEDGIHTYDIYREGVSKMKVGTDEFARAVIERLGDMPRHLKPVQYTQKPVVTVKAPVRTKAQKALTGVDVFLHWNDGSAQQLGERMQQLSTGRFKLDMITNRGVKVFPNGFPETFCTDHWRCRYMAVDGSPLRYDDVLDLTRHITSQQLDIIKTENLYLFDGKPGYSLGQGQ